MAEWSKALAWKVSIRQNRIEGSNPSRSASFRKALRLLRDQRSQSLPQHHFPTDLYGTVTRATFSRSATVKSPGVADGRDGVNGVLAFT